ncbi:hypothetical protein SAMN05421853_104151 [Roseivivax halotolerans]|uniref:Uncharacterized protein n=1 Tax=Roseivivax halotolerans TaxID=93684 RepID=A0A1I5XVK8_9RHOB|nr:hypothetical protein [Roseivivax halotolerans]SFQ35900.1 hypothetical protein SAMN05421853_104151 [Roseivivax halotolerans]
MKAMILGFVAIAVVSVGAWFGLNTYGFSAADRTASNSAVRLGDAGPRNSGSPTETEATE